MFLEHLLCAKPVPGAGDTDAPGPGVFLLSRSLSLKEEPRSTINQVSSVSDLVHVELKRKRL